MNFLAGKYTGCTFALPKKPPLWPYNKENNETLKF